MKTLLYLKILAIGIGAILISTFAFVIYAEVRYEDSLDYYYVVFDGLGDFKWSMIDYILFIDGIVYFIVDVVLWIWYLPSYLLSTLAGAWEEEIKPLLMLIGGVVAVWLIISLGIKLSRGAKQDDDESSLAQGYMWVSGILFLLPVAIISLSIIVVLGLDGGGYDDSNDYYEEPYSEPGVHWVDDYYRSDGTHVDGHWRSNPDEYEWNNLNP